MPSSYPHPSLKRPRLSGDLREVVTAGVLGLYHLPVSFIYFLIVTSWSNGLVWYLPQLLRFRLVTFFRALQVTRTVHGYGVFHPKSLPPLKHTPVFEGSDDGVHWLPYVPRRRVRRLRSVHLTCPALGASLCPVGLCALHCGASFHN
jgi:hypothetical protein